MSMGVYNWSGISITLYLSANSRAVVDPTRAMFIWIVSILLNWESWITMQFIGFLFSTSGMLIFN